MTGFRPVAARIAADHLARVEHAARTATACDRPLHIDPFLSAVGLIPGRG